MEDDDDEKMQMRVLAEMKPQIERILHGLFEKCYNKGNFHEALGMCACGIRI